MQRNLIYSFVLLVMMSGWLVTNPTLPKPAAEQKTQTASQIITDPACIGLTPETWTSDGDCNIEFINGKPIGSEAHIIPKDTFIKLTGWAMDIKNSRLPKSVIVCFRGTDEIQFFAPSQNRLERRDVKDYFALSDNLLESGFELLTNLRRLPIGEYDITLAMTFENATLICDNGRKIRVQ